MATIYLINCPLMLNSEHTIWFDNETAQQNYFINRSFKTLTDYNYQRKEGTIRVNAYIEDVIKCNYVMYKNSDYSSKWYYAFVKDIKYHNDSYTDLFIETDPIQTWLFDYNVGECFVEREHVNDDTFGLHTQPEGLEIGEYMHTDDLVASLNFRKDNCCGVVAVSELLDGITYNTANLDVPTGNKYIACTSNKGIEDLIYQYDKAGKGEAVQYIFVAPTSFFGNWGECTIDGTTLTGNFSTNLNFEITTEIDVIKDNWLGTGYYPKNKKLLTYPYSLIQLTNNSGAVSNYRWEYFNYGKEEKEYSFKIKGTICPGCSFICYPANYKGIPDNRDEGIPFGKLPIGSWNSDVYTNWLTQNSVNLIVDGVSSVASIVGGAALTMTGVGATIGVGMMAGGILNVSKTMGQIHQTELIPNQAKGNANTGDVNYQFGYSGVFVKTLSITDEYAKLIDDYFSMYGYKVNAIKIPNKDHRAFYWHTKTIEANITGNIPSTDRAKIIEAYDRGITFWRSNATFRKYDVENDILENIE